MTDKLPTAAEAAEVLGGFELEPFEGLPVIQAKIEIPDAAGGLREAMAIEPRAWHKGDRCFVLLECLVNKVRVDPITDDLVGPQARVHVLKTLAGTVLEPDVAKDWIDGQKDRILKAKEQALGIQQVAELNPDGSPAPGMGDVSPALTDADGFVDPANVRTVLENLSKDDLRAMCKAEGLTHPVKATGKQLVTLLVDKVPDLAEKITAAAANNNGSGLRAMPDPE